MSVRFLPAGDRGLVVEFGNEVSLEVNTQVRALALACTAARPRGVIEVVPTYRSLGVHFDPAIVGSEELEERVREVLATLDPERLPTPKVVELPTVYGGEYGPDLPFVAEHARLPEAEVIRLHSETPYHVYMIGFTAGFAYLGGLPERLHTPRLPSPRTRTPRGAVGIGGSQTGAYPAETPGGWRLIGRTPVPLFDPLRDPPTPMEPGDTVRFVPIDEAEYRQLEWREPSAESREEASHVSSQLSPLGSRPAIEVLQAGFLTTVQDRGRYGSQRFGVPVSGAMDESALRLGNILVGNPQGMAGLEITYAGPRLRFHRDAILALTGAEVEADLEGQAVLGCESFLARVGQILEIRRAVRGVRSYLAVAGGIDVPVCLGSRSTNLVATFGGFEGRPLRDGDRLPLGPSLASPRSAGRSAPADWRPTFPSPQAVRVVFGPQADAFTEAGRRTLLEATYEVSAASDRMGFRLEGPAIEHAGPADIISDWIPPGGIQVPGNGQPIVLLADRQTTGGYPKIATVIGPDVGKVAQCQPGARLRFQVVSVQEAQQIARAAEGALHRLESTLTDLSLWGSARETGGLC